MQCSPIRYGDLRISGDRLIDIHGTFFDIEISMVSAHTAIDSQGAKSLFIDGIFSISRIAATDRARDGVRIRIRFSIFPDFQCCTVSDVEIGLTATIHVHESAACFRVATIRVAIVTDTGYCISCIRRIFGDIESRARFQNSLFTIMVRYIGCRVQINRTTHRLCMVSAACFIIIECDIIKSDIGPLNHHGTGFGSRVNAGGTTCTFDLIPVKRGIRNGHGIGRLYFIASWI